MTIKQISGRDFYLLIYNLIHSVGWATFLITFLCSEFNILPAFISIEKSFKLVLTLQTLMFLDVIHSMIGLVGGVWVNTLLQVASRILVVWGVLFVYPAIIQSIFTKAMFVAWSLAEVIRYSYYIIKTGTQGRKVPQKLTWLRYSAFYVLYPIGVLTGEVPVVITAIIISDSLAYRAFFAFATLCYIPGFPILFKHMIRQRTKVFAKEKSKEE
eukprot:gnl/Dysnectes_brevis/5154_a7285_809.p1 GENE.gnl/Dysnectes_brevis/5154_a7285_809~~gnl/Dysnectes_brevis/5154_a7285_809.p1  ORF type:complete len:222 (-),score=8.16 gnl/Dysnectes_brevis/5154_a7285_809:107-745(-)